MGIDTVLMCYLEADWANQPPEDLPSEIRGFLANQQTQHIEDMQREQAKRDAEIKRLQSQNNAAGASAAPGAAPGDTAVGMT